MEQLESVKTWLRDEMNNPYFWVLVGVLVIAGWIYLGASFGVKKFGTAKGRIG